MSGPRPHEMDTRAREHVAHEPQRVPRETEHADASVSAISAGHSVACIYDVLGCPVGIQPCPSLRGSIDARLRITAPDEALALDWHTYETGVLDVPIGQEGAFIEKAKAEVEQGWEGIVCLSERQSTHFRAIHEISSAICLAADATFAYTGIRYEDFARAFASCGLLIYPRHDRALTARITGRTMRHVYAPGATQDLYARAKRCEREIRATRYHGVAVGVMNLPHETTVREILGRDDMPELRAIIEDLTLHELGQALLLLSGDPVATPPPVRPKPSTATVDKRQLGLPVHLDSRAYHTDAERDRFDQRIWQTLCDAGQPMRRADIIKINPCTEHEYRGAIMRLSLAAKIEKVGDGPHARYRAAQPTEDRTG